MISSRVFSIYVNATTKNLKHHCPSLIRKVSFLFLFLNHLYSITALSQIMQPLNVENGLSLRIASTGSQCVFWREGGWLIYVNRKYRWNTRTQCSHVYSTKEHSHYRYIPVHISISSKLVGKHYVSSTSRLF